MTQIVQSALEGTEKGYLGKLLQKHQPAKTGATFKEQQSLDRLSKAHWQKVPTTLEGLPANVVAYVANDVQGYAAFMEIAEIHPCMLLEPVKMSVRDIKQLSVPAVRGNFRKLGPTVILLEEAKDQAPVVYDIHPGGYQFVRLGTAAALPGKKAVASEFKQDGWSHAVVLPRS